MATKIHCTLVETPTVVTWPIDETEGYPRDLLPWADPYIAQLLRKYELRTGASATETEGTKQATEQPRLGRDWNDIELPAADDSPYEWDAFRFRGRGIV